jgi:hypothetical protein
LAEENAALVIGQADELVRFGQDAPQERENWLSTRKPIDLFSQDLRISRNISQRGVGYSRINPGLFRPYPRFPGDSGNIAQVYILAGDEALPFPRELPHLWSV